MPASRRRDHRRRPPGCGRLGEHVDHQRQPVAAARRAEQVERPVACSSRVSGTWRAATSTTRTAIGRLIRNASRHPTAPCRPARRRAPGRSPRRPRPGRTTRQRPQRDRPDGNRLEDGERSRREQRGADRPATRGCAIRTLGVGARAQPAEASGEPDRADDEDAPPAQPIAEAAAEQQQSRQRERVRVDRPLQAGQARHRGRHRCAEARR